MPADFSVSAGGATGYGSSAYLACQSLNSELPSPPTPPDNSGHYMATPFVGTTCVIKWDEYLDVDPWLTEHTAYSVEVVEGDSPEAISQDMVDAQSTIFGAFLLAGCLIWGLKKVYSLLSPTQQAHDV